MKKTLQHTFAYALCLILFASSFAVAQKKPIFNGKDLDGWKIYGTEKWYVEDGLLFCESGPDKGYGYLATEKFYKDFELELEFFHKVSQVCAPGFLDGGELFIFGQIYKKFSFCFGK